MAQRSLSLFVHCWDRGFGWNVAPKSCLVTELAWSEAGLVAIAGRERARRCLSGFEVFGRLLVAWSGFARRCCARERSVAKSWIIGLGSAYFGGWLAIMCEYQVVWSRGQLLCKCFERDVFG